MQKPLRSRSDSDAAPRAVIGTFGVSVADQRKVAELKRGARLFFVERIVVPEFDTARLIPVIDGDKRGLDAGLEQPELTVALPSFVGPDAITAVLDAGDVF